MKIVKRNTTLLKSKAFPRVDLDLKLLTETHKKLVNGCPVEPHIVSILLLSGIQNILSQNEEFDKSLERIKVLERENMDTKLRVESIETWLIKLNDNVEDVSRQIMKGSKRLPW